MLPVVIVVVIGVMGIPLTGLPMDKNALKSETITGRMSAKNGFSWRYSYDIAFDKEKIIIQVGIRLVPHGGVTRMDLDRVKSKWEKGIEETWSNKFSIRTSSEQTYPIIVDVSFNRNSSHHQVIVRPGGGRSEIIYWNIMDTPAVAAHEFGHMIGVYDEYKGGALDPKNKMVDATSIMTCNPCDGITYARHYQQFLKWFHKKTELQGCMVCPMEGEQGELARK
jgi:hypothetical protein